MDFTSSLAGPDSTAPAAAPASPQAQAPAPAQAQAPNAGTTDIGALAELPPVRALIEGNPPAIYADEGINTPLTQTIGRNFKSIGELGLALYRSPSKKMVMFNPEKLDVHDLLAADKAGKLDSVAKPLSDFEQGSATQTPSPDASAPDAGSASPAAGSPAPLTKGLTPRAQSRLAGDRLKNLMDDEEPSKRPIPGAGTILNSLAQRAV